MNRVISIRGRSGSVLGLFPAVDESSEEIWRGIKHSFPEAGICQVEQKLHVQLTAVLPQFQGLSLDPTHAAMHYEQATFLVERLLNFVLRRRFMAKFTGIWRLNPRGCLTEQENMICHHKKQSYASRFSQHLCPEEEQLFVIQDPGELDVWPTRIQFIEAVAALASQQWEEYVSIFWTHQILCRPHFWIL